MLVYCPDLPLEFYLFYIQIFALVTVLVTCVSGMSHAPFQRLIQSIGKL